MKEANIQNAIRLAAVKHACFLLRNNVGMLQDRNGQYVRYGLSTGSSDLIGWTMRNKIAVFTAVEVKRPGKQPTPEQARFLEAVKAAGGIALCVHSVEEFEEGMR